MPPKGRKNTSPNNGEGLAEPDPRVQGVMGEPLEPPQEDPPPAASTEPTAAPESATPEGYEGTPTEAHRTQTTEPAGHQEEKLDEELRAAEKRVKYLQIQQRIRALEADIARSQGSIVSSEPLYEKVQEQDQIAPDGHPTDLAAPIPRDLTPTAPPVRNRPIATADNHREDSESENEVSNKPPTKKAVSETYHGRNQRELQIFEANLKNHFDIHRGYIRNSNRRKIAEALQCIDGNLMLQWQHHREELDHAPTFDEFMEFLLHQVSDPRTYTEQAALKYYTAQQKPTQSTRDFATYMRGWEYHLTHPLPEYHRRERFRAGLREELRLGLAYFPRDNSETFEGFVSYVQGCEDQMKATRDQQKKSTKDRGYDPNKGSNSRGTRTPSRSSGEGTSRWKSNDQPRDGPFSGHKRKATFTDKCYNCNQIGHRWPDCPAAKDKFANKSKN